MESALLRVFALIFVLLVPGGLILAIAGAFLNYWTARTREQHPEVAEKPKPGPYAPIFLVERKPTWQNIEIPPSFDVSCVSCELSENCPGFKACPKFNP